MAITHIGRTTIYVDDQDRAKAFYTDVLGFELVIDMPMGDPGTARWIEIRPPGASDQHHDLHRRRGGAPAERHRGRGAVRDRDDVEATFDDLKSEEA